MSELTQALLKAIKDTHVRLLTPGQAKHFVQMASKQ